MVHFPSASSLKCARLFGKIIDETSQAKERGIIPATSWTEMEDQFTRFKVWAGTLSAFDGAVRSNMSPRVVDHEEDLLLDLCATLQDGQHH
jgi:hypothetical protein